MSRRRATTPAASPRACPIRSSTVRATRSPASIAASTIGVRFCRAGERSRGSVRASRSSNASTEGSPSRSQSISVRMVAGPRPVK